MSMKDWFTDTLFDNINSELDEEIVKVLADLNGEYMTNWVLEIVADNPNIKEFSLPKKLSAYHSKYISSINDYFCEKFDDIPIEFVEYLGAKAQKTVNILI